MRQTEDAHDMTVVFQRRGADFDGDTRSVGTNDVDLEIGDVSAEELAGEDFARTALVFRRDDFGEVPATRVADNPPRRLVEPANPPRSVEDVAWDAHARQRALEPASKCAELCAVAVRSVDIARSRIMRPEAWHNPPDKTAEAAYSYTTRT
jgi:hypothetical protein